MSRFILEEKMDNVDYLRASLIETRRNYKLVKKQLKALKKILREKEQQEAPKNYKSMRIYPNNRK